MKQAILILTLLIGSAWPAAGEIIDRVVAVVGREAITRSEIEREARLEAFFEGRPPESATQDGEMLERVIRQRLVRQEMQQTTLPSAEEAQVKKWLDENLPRGADAAAYRLRHQDLADYARRNIDTMRFIELRFKPGLQPGAEQTETYYKERLLPELRRKGVREIPTLEESRSQIEQILVEQRVNELLDEWLKELRARVHVKIFETGRP